MENHIATLFVLVLIFSCSNTKTSEIVDTIKSEQIQTDSYLSAKIDGVKFHTDETHYNSMLNIGTLAAVSNSLDPAPPKSQLERLVIFPQRIDFPS